MIGAPVCPAFERVTAKRRAKSSTLESKDDLKRRIDEAAQYAPMEQLELSPQCGFSSTVHSNDIAVEAQRAKLRRVIETANEMWGES